LLSAPTEMVAAERNQIDFVYVGPPPSATGGRESAFLSGWDSLLQSEVSELLDAGDFWAVKQTSDGVYLLDVRVHPSSHEAALSGRALLQAFKDNQFFQIVENIPVNDGGDKPTWHGNIYVENKLNLNEAPVRRFNLERQLSPEATTAFPG